MFINKKKYKEKLDLLEGYRQSRDKKQEKIYDLEIQISRLENKIDRLESNNTALINENSKLTEWIYKIINEVGCYEVSEYNSIRIPVYRNECVPYNEEHLKEMKMKEIVLPQICFMKMERN
ncbi:MAG: hypothetical protein HFJ50_06555 [Clostridia bacterium]|jgi:hypothetical protein|nr:hypothetical protein [Clostridia bacterium]